MEIIGIVHFSLSFFCDTVKTEKSYREVKKCERIF